MNSSLYHPEIYHHPRSSHHEWRSTS